MAGRLSRCACLGGAAFGPVAEGAAKAERDVADARRALVRAKGDGDVTEGSSSTSTLDVEVRIDLAASMDKSEVLMALDNLKRYIAQDTWPPA